jgi:two-component system, cell cycle response regulator
MTTLVHAAGAVRKSARLAFGYVTAACVTLLVLTGAFSRELSLGWEHLLLLLAFGTALMARKSPRARRAARARDAAGLDLELGCLLFSAAHALLQHLGGLLSPFYPIMYALAAFAGAFASRVHVRWLLGLAIALEAPIYFLTEGRADPKPYLLHGFFIVLFGATNALFTQTELYRLHKQAQQDRAEEKRRINQEARLFRLAEKPATTAAKDEEHLWRGSVSGVKSSVHWNLLLLKRTLQLHSALLLLRDPRDGRLWVVESTTDSQNLWDGPFPPGEGPVGAAYQRGVLTNLSLRPGQSGLCYYRNRNEPVRAFVAVPVRERGEIIGVLCVDRREDRAFTSQEEAILSGSVEHVLCALNTERVFVQLEHSKREQDVLYEASQALGAATTEQAVLNAALAAATQLVVHDFAAVTHYDSQADKHTIRRVVGDGAADFAALSFSSSASLTSMAVQNRHYLPFRGDFDPQNQTVFVRGERLANMHSVLILPLCVRDSAIGTLVLAARRRDAFPLDVRPALQLLANQLAVALSNAASVARLEELATTDGLTGCYNKRHFHNELTARMHAAERNGHQISLVIADIDHFKAVNDTYGHHVGDVVIRELGQILKQLRSETDLVARFGGEEFCVLCDQTSTRAALELAERARIALGHAVFETENGPLKVTCSLGVASYPDHASNQETLFEAADRALYAAKHAGRNQVCSSQ